MRDETELLRRYAQEHDHEAFSELVARTIGFVHACAVRQCRGNVSLAQDVTQLVFTDLSRRARIVVAHPTLVGWLHTATRFAAMKVLRTESRRQVRDRQAAELQSLLADELPRADWARLQPVLDEAIGELKERDRAAILLRFFQGKSLLEIGACLQLSETAARSCVDRALERLRGPLARRGVTSTGAALGLALSQQTATAAPAGLATTVSGIAISHSVVKGAALVPLFAMKKLIITTAMIALAAEMATATVELKTKWSLEAEQRQLEIAAATRVTPVAATVLSAAQSASGAPNAAAATSAPAAGREIARLEKRLAQLKARPMKVTDEQMKAPRPAGRDTPVNAMQTLTAALRDRDMEALDRFVMFADDTPENRAAFMANFSDAIRDRYRTPERLMVAFSFAEVLRDSPVAQQVLSTHGYSGGVQTVTTWTRLASGLERQDTVPFGSTPDGWALSSLRMTDKASIPIDLMKSTIDPITGAVTPPIR